MHMHAQDEEQNSYYLDQLCTIGICGALAVVLILAYVNNALNEILNPKFHQPVLWGGLALLILVAVRAVAIWIASGKQPVAQGHSHAAGHEHVHDHEHAHECGHDHEHVHAGTPEPHSHTHAACDHDHSHGAHDHEHGHEHSHAVADDHGHEHGWAPWRYAVLLLPIVLYFLGIPAGRAYEPDAPEEGGIPNLDFKEVEQAAFAPEGRQYWEGREGRLMGKVSGKSSDGKVLRLYRDKVTCCYADAYPIKILIQSAQPVQQGERTWVKVVGKVTFHKAPDRDEWLTVMVADSVKSMDRPPANPNVN